MRLPAPCVISCSGAGALKIHAVSGTSNSINEQDNWSLDSFSVPLSTSDETLFPTVSHDMCRRQTLGTCTFKTGSEQCDTGRSRKEVVQKNHNCWDVDMAVTTEWT